MTRQAALRLGQIAFAIGLFGVLWWVADGPEAARRLVGADPLWLVAALGFLTIQTVVSALRWRLTAGQLGIVLGRRLALREYYLSQIINQTLPGGFLGDASRAVRARGQAGLMAAGQAVMFERLGGQIALFLLLAFAFGATWAVPGGLTWPAWAAGLVGAVVLGGFAVAVVLLAAMRWMPGALGRGLVAQAGALRHALAGPDVWHKQTILSLGGMLCNVAAFGCCAWAVGVPLSVVAVLALVPLILFTMLIPLTVSGWGLREGAAAALFPLAGATASGGLAASVAFGLMFLVSVLPGFAFLALGASPRTMPP